MTAILFNKEDLKPLLTDPNISHKLAENSQFPCFTEQIDVLNFLKPGPWQSLDKFCPKAFSSLLQPQSLILGSPFEPYKLSLPKLDLAKIASLKSCAQSLGADIIFAPNLDPNSDAAKNLQSINFMKIPSFPDTILKLQGSNFLQYLAEQKAKNRYEIKKNLNIFEKLGHKISWLEKSPLSLSIKNYESYLANRTRAQVKWIKYPFSYFHHWLSFKNTFCAVAKNSQGFFLGFLFGFKINHVFHLGRMAIDPSFLRQDKIYFCLFYEAIKKALELDCHQLSLGPTAYGIKKKMGAKQKALNNFIFPISKPWRILLNSFPEKFLTLPFEYLENERYLEIFF